MKPFMLAAVIVATTSAASASTLTFGDFTSTNAVQLNPTVTINNSAANEFLVSIMLATGEFGTLGGVFFDIAAPTSSANGLSYSAGTPNASALTASNFTFAVDAAGFNAADIDQGVCTNNTNLNGLSGLPAFEIGVCYKSTGPSSSRPTNGLTTVSFTIVDTTAGFLTLEQFAGVGLRYQESSNGGSDKLFSSTRLIPPPPPPPPPSAVPLPAAGWMLLAGLGGLLTWGRRRSA